MLLGSGVRLSDDGEERALETVECTSFESGLVELRYDVTESAP